MQVVCSQVGSSLCRQMQLCVASCQAGDAEKLVLSDFGAVLPSGLGLHVMSLLRPSWCWIFRMICVTCDAGLAVARGIWRKIRTGRSVPIAAQLRSHR